MAHKYSTLDLIEDLKTSGLTQKAYCSQKNIPVSSLAYHLKKHRKNRALRAEQQSEPSFIPVNVKTSSANRSRTIIIMRGEFSCDELISIASSELS